MSIADARKSKHAVPGRLAGSLRNRKIRLRRANQCQRQGVSSESELCEATSDNVCVCVVARPLVVFRPAIPTLLAARVSHRDGRQRARTLAQLFGATVRMQTRTRMAAVALTFSLDAR